MLLTYFAGYTFTTPPASAPFGNLGRNAFRGPSFEQWDLAVNKDFFFGERYKLQFRSEFFNILNHTNFAPPNQQSNSASFGTDHHGLPGAPDPVRTEAAVLKKLEAEMFNSGRSQRSRASPSPGIFWPDRSGLRIRSCRKSALLIGSISRDRGARPTQS